MRHSGFYNMKTPEDLLNKAKRDFEKLKNDNSNTDLAFNFFVTIEHMPDWLMLDRQSKKAIKDSSHVLRVCSHLASGIKHLEPFNDYKSVKSVKEDSVYEDGVYEDGIFEKWLTINLDDDEIVEFGKNKLNTIELGQSILKYWEDYLNINTQP